MCLQYVKFFAQLIIISKMSDSSHCSSIAKERSMRRRVKPNRKWSEEEVGRIVNFLKEHQQSFEMPTAQIFYKKMIREAHIDAEWHLIKWKVRNMRTAYNKAAEWKNVTGADILEEQAIKKKRYKLCPHFNTLEDIFSKSKPSLCSVNDSANHEGKTQSFCVPVDEVQQSFQLNDSVVEVLEPEPLPDKSEANAKASTFVRKMRKTAPNTAVSRLSDLPLQMQRLQFDKERHLEETLRENKRLRLQTERLYMEMERQDKMLLIKAEKLALEREKIRIMERELEMKERLARYELELKYIFLK